MRKFLSLILCIALLCAVTSIGMFASGVSNVSSVQTYEASSITARNGEISDLNNHTIGGDNSVQLTSVGYKPNYQISQVLITDGEGVLIPAQADETYIFTAYIYSEKIGGDDVKFKILNTNTSFSYAEGDVMFEKKGVMLEEGNWVKVSFMFTTPETLSKPCFSYAMTANKETADNYTDTDVYYIDDVSLILASELTSKSIVSSPNKVGLYHNETDNSSVYTSGGTQYSSFRVYAKYQSFAANASELDYYDTCLAIEERGILVSDNNKAEDEFLLDAPGVRRGYTSGSGLSSYWDYNYSSKSVTYCVTIGDISYANKDLSFAIRPYLKLSLDNGTLLIYGNVQRGDSGNGFSLQWIYDKAKADLGYPTWFNGSLSATELSLYNNGLSSLYKIVRPASMSDTMLKSTLDFYSEFNGEFDGGIPITTDASAATQYEILIGETSRSESTSAYNQLSGGSDADYVIKLSGSKIVIAANSDYALERALNEFKDSVVTPRKTISKTLNEGYTCSPVTLKTASAGWTVAPNSSTSYDFKIHTPKYPSYFTMEAARTLADYVQHKTGVTLSILKDGVSSTTRSFYICDPETSNLPDTQYKVTFSGGVIKVDAGSTDALLAGISALTDMFESGEGVPAEKIGSIVGENVLLPNNYSLSWNDEFDGETLDTTKWSAMTDVTAGPWYRTNESYYTNSSSSAQWLTGNYIAASFADNNVSISYDTSKATKNKIGNDMIFFDNIDSDYVSELSGLITGAGGRILLADTVENSYAQEGLQLRPSDEGTDNTYYVAGGILHEITSKAYYGYDAVRVATDRTMSYRYGITETRIMAATNNGACSAVWTSAKNTNEIDVYENGGEDMFRSNLHTFELVDETYVNKDYIGTKYMKLIDSTPNTGEHFYNTFHYLGYEWTDTYIAFYLDGDITQVVDITDSIFDGLRSGTSLRIANGVGTLKYSTGSNPGNKLGSGAASFCEEQLVDYVRIYQKKDTISKMSVK